MTREFFPPEHGDEQGVQLSLPPDPFRISGEQLESAAAERLATDLHAYYQPERQADRASLERAWSRIHASLPEQHANSQTTQQSSSLPLLKFPQERVSRMDTTTREQTHGSLGRALSLLVAVIVMAALVGSMAVVFKLAHQGASSHTSSPARATTFGQVVYSSPRESGYATDLAWSPVSQRIAVVGTPIQIWDATTGQHRVSVALNAGEDVSAAIAWSPTSNLLAIPTLQRVAIVDGQTGQIVTSYPIPSSSATTFPTTGTRLTGSTYLADFIPLGGIPRFGGVAWSPDGKSIVSTFSSATADGLVQIWDPQTGKLSFTLAQQADTGFGDIAWSSDGQYIAATSWNWRKSLQAQINVWSTKTHQIVFQHAGDDFLGATWQPGSHILASSDLSQNAYGKAVLHIWNVDNGQEVKSIPGAGAWAMSWSPDGKEFAYNDPSDPTTRMSIIIQDFASGHKVYTYTSSLEPSRAVWSPDGKYIASLEIQNASSSSSGTTVTPVPDGHSPFSYVVKVWTAY